MDFFFFSEDSLSKTTTFLCCNHLSSLVVFLNGCSVDILTESVCYYQHSTHRLFFKDLIKSLTKLYRNVGYAVSSRCDPSSRQGIYCRMEWTAGQGIQDTLHGNQEKAGAGGGMSTPGSHPNMKSGPLSYQQLVLKCRHSLIKSIFKDYHLLSVQGPMPSLGK